MWSFALIGLCACGFRIAAPTNDTVDASSRDDANDDVDAAIDVADGPQPAGPYVRLIDLDDTKVSGGPHADFPLLVSISAPWLRAKSAGGDVARSDGFDVYFSADQVGTTRLAHEVEAYDADSGLLVAWVKLPQLTATTVLYVHYGDESIAASQENVPSVWAGGFQLVLHLDALTDSTGKSTSMTTMNVSAATGRIDRAQQFNAIDSRINVGSATSVDNVFAAGGTAEAWFYATGVGEGSYGRLFDKGHPNGWAFFINNVEYANALTFYHDSSGGVGAWATPSQSITLNAWHYASAVFDKSSIANQPVVYIDGVPMALTRYFNPGGTMSSDASYDLLAGNRSNGDRTFDGVLDEMRLSSIARGADWILTTYRNQVAPASFYVVSSAL